MTSSNESLNGMEVSIGEEVGRGNDVVKEEFASASFLLSTEGESDCESVGVPLEQDEWFDCNSFEEEWSDCRTFEPHHSRTVKCRQSSKPILPAYPSAFMILSTIMLSMYCVGMIFRSLGRTWNDDWICLLPCLGSILDLYIRLKLYWWPPPLYKKITLKTKFYNKIYCFLPHYQSP